MSEVVTAVAVVLLALLAAGAAAQWIGSYWRTPKPTTVDRLLRSKVVVTLKTGESFGGVLWEHDRTALVLRKTYGVGMAEKDTNLPVDGELLLYLVDIAYVQKP
jgi:small nuclear ribonucleoprotein (snRNP)-like protein